MSEANRPGAIRRTGRFVGRQVSYLLYVEHIKKGGRMVATQWGRVSRKVCPSCEAGRLFPFSELVAGAERKYLGCNHCAYYQDHKLVDDSPALVTLRSRAHQKISGMTADEYAAMIRKYQVASRWFFGAFVLLIVLAVVMMINEFIYGGEAADIAMSFFGVLTTSLLFFVKGLTASYRCWQVQERVFFRPGSFRRWLKLGVWLI